MRQCNGCGLLFIPDRPGQDRCGNCAPRKRVPFAPKPIDLFREWSDKDEC